VESWEPQYWSLKTIASLHDSFYELQWLQRTCCIEWRSCCRIMKFGVFWCRWIFAQETTQFMAPNQYPSCCWSSRKRLQNSAERPHNCWPLLRESVLSGQIVMLYKPIDFLFCTTFWYEGVFLIIHLKETFWWKEGISCAQISLCGCGRYDQFNGRAEFTPVG